jgi:putative ABC transport system ATP-binding protein
VPAADGDGPALLRVQDLARRHGEATVFAGVGLAVRAGEFVALLGESGVGKSTLLNCIAGLDDPDHGQVWLGPAEVTALDDDGRARLRREHIGFVFQAFHVLPHLNVADNVGLPLRLLGRHDPARVAALLSDVGLQGLGGRMPAQLSGGQLQRVAIARALVHAPALVLADEPTGNLDPATAARVMDVLVRQARANASACLLVTHSAAAAAVADRVLHLTPDGIVEAAPPAGGP